MKVAIWSVALVALTGAYGAAAAADADNLKGLWLTTDYPALQVRAGDDTTLPLTIYNYGLPPQRTALSITDKPQDWKTTIEGAGKPVSAAFVSHDGSASLSLKIDAPATAKPGHYTLALHAQGDDGKSDLPISIDLAPPLKAKLTATPKLPVLEGTPKTAFDFSVTVKNESASSMLANLSAKTPDGFVATFKEGYGSQELTTIPLKAGESKDLSVSIKPPESAAAGKYPALVEIKGGAADATTKLTMDVAGQPALSFTGKDDRVSGNAYAGKQATFPMLVRNSGSADARDISLSATAPPGWKISFDPKKIADVPANGEAPVQAQVQPAAQAIAGDYVVAMRANGDGLSDMASYRVTVRTSTLWGVTGVGIIAAAMLVLVGSVARFGRR